ncbi:amino acid kinase family protein [Lacticaseibacillus zhaodongensis]|uniref:amino acid kinase family protein n=1 Tax=Lacticaseibacillus zhaodongensis TaxID=2668065 RepID=UPI0012D2EB96|nr:hypothetical protein [Lacticaseibacillus zhaodongensis]
MIPRDGREMCHCSREIITQHVQPHLLKQLRTVGVAPAVLQGGIEASVINEARYGQVGQLSAIDTHAVDQQLAGTGALLVGPLLPSAAGKLLNVNADDVAMALAQQLQVTQLHFVTDVPGVLDANGCVVSRLTPALMNDLSASSVITGGMSVKLRAGLAVAATHTTKVTIGNVIEPAGTVLVA